MRNLRTKSVLQMLFECDPAAMEQQKSATSVSTTIDVTVDVHVSSDANAYDSADNDAKLRTARRSLHRYIFVVCHTMQHFGHHLTANEFELVQTACEKTLRWMWSDKQKSLESYQQRIKLMMQICGPFMERLFRAEQRSTDHDDKVIRHRQSAPFGKQ